MIALRSRFVVLLAACTTMAALGGVRANGVSDVVLIANAEDGTVQVLDLASASIVRTIDVIPDGDSPDPTYDPEQAVAFPLVTGAAGDNFAQDLDLSPDGRTLYVSRGHLGDVAAFDMGSGALLWKTPVAGFRADHMDIDEDGSRLFVSAITDNRVEVLDAATGSRVGAIAAGGQWPHDVHVSGTGRFVFIGTIGNVLTPWEVRSAMTHAGVGPYALVIAEAGTYRIARAIEFEAGVRPFVFDPAETKIYAQLSEFHGVVEVDVTRGVETRRLALPIDEGVTEDDYDFEAPHHGIAISGDGSTLCIAGRASDYVALVSTATMTATHIIDVDDAPGWAATTPDGRSCVVASTRADTVTVVAYGSGQIEAVVATGDGPKYLLPAVL